MLVKNEDLHFGALFILCLAPLPLVFGFVPCVYFDSECIDIDVHPKSVSVTCLYNYRNPWPVPVVQCMAFPVPVDRFHPKPLSVTAEEVKSKARLAVRESSGEKAMSVFFKPFERKTVVARYEQRCEIPTARYILLSTRAWGAPLQQGMYTLTEHGARITSSNYPIESTRGMVHAFERHNFMPNQDWEFTWVPQQQYSPTPRISALGNDDAASDGQ